MGLKDVIGQERAVEFLTRSIESGRVATSYLFSGEQGIGKRLTALEFARALNCREVITGGNGEGPLDACGSCPSCRKIEAGSHPDFALVTPEPAQQIKVEEIRKLEEVLSLKAHEGKYKTVIVDEAQQMHPAAANAFLKTLEEPPAGSLIILVSSAPDLLLETIRSRCVRINFTPLSPEKCQEVLLRRAAEARPEKGKKKKSRGPDAAARSGEDPEALAALVRLAMGRPGQAVSEDLIAERDSFLSSLKNIVEVGGKAPWKDRAEIERWFDLALIHLRDLAVLSLGMGGEHLINRDRHRELEGAATDARGGVEGIIETYAALLEMRRELRFNLNKSLTANRAGLRFARLGGRLR